MGATRIDFFERLSVISDELRGRIVALLHEQELTVSELCAVLQLPQSTVSRHLRALADSSWVESRPDGPRRLYRAAIETPERPGGDLWPSIHNEVVRTPSAGQDRRRLRTVLARRRHRSREFFAGEADRWDRLRDELFGPSFFLVALLGLLPEDSTVADLGCGTGPVSETLAPVVRRVVAVDDSGEMLAAARERLGRYANVEVRQGSLEELPLEDGSSDLATLVLVLHHLPDPVAVVAEVRRILRPGGRLLIVDMLPHAREEYRRDMGHVWLGFHEERIAQYLAGAGFDRPRFRALPASLDARGPALFSCIARAPAPGSGASSDGVGGAS